MKQNLFEINSDERNRILEMHKARTANHYIYEQKQGVEKVAAGEQTISLQIQRKAVYQPGSTDPSAFIDLFIQDVMNKINANPEAKKMLTNKEMQLMKIVVAAGASNNWNGVATGYDLGQSGNAYQSMSGPQVLPTDKALKYYKKNKRLAGKRAKAFIPKLAAKLQAQGIFIPKKYEQTTAAYVVNTGGALDNERDTSKFGMPGQYIGATIVFGYKKTVFKYRFYSITDIKKEFVLTGSYFCNGTNALQRNKFNLAAQDTYKPMCDPVIKKYAKSNPQQLKRYMSAFEIKWQPNVLRNPWTAPVLRWKFFWGDNGRGGFKVIKVVLLYVNKNYVPTGIFPEGQSSIDDPKLKYMMGLNEGRTQDGGSMYKAYLFPDGV